MKLTFSMFICLFFVAGCASGGNALSRSTPTYNVGAGDKAHYIVCDDGRYNVKLSNHGNSSQEENDAACRAALPLARNDLEARSSSSSNVQFRIILQKRGQQHHDHVSRSEQRGFVDPGNPVWSGSGQNVYRSQPQPCLQCQQQVRCGSVGLPSC